LLKEVLEGRTIPHAENEEQHFPEMPGVQGLVFSHIDQTNWIDLEVLDFDCLVLYLYLGRIIKSSSAHFSALFILI
jgi:hypothetical protein